MESLVCIQPGDLEYQQIPEPVFLEGYAILKVKRIGVCGTDLHAFEGTQPYFSYPRILGHELALEVAEAKEFQKGEPVTIVPYFNCGKCIACKNDKPNCCSQLKVFGVHIDGGMREYVSVPQSSLIHGKGLSFEELALTEPLAIGVHAVSRAGIKPGEFVLVMGAGPIGLGIMEFAKMAGATVIALDINEQRLLFCREKLGVAYTINGVLQDVAKQLKEITGRDMPTVVIDATGNLNAINNAFQYMAHGARYVLVGLQKEEIRISHPEFHKREATLMSSRNATHNDFEMVINSIKNRSINPSHYVTHKVHFGEVKNNFKNWLNPANGVIKAMIEME
jgi:threonine dehydrogenase-like Zn-dependent dehydrogenase